jgi:O-antigen/teichoic acid export membrane protein
VGSAVSQALYPRLAVASPAQARRSVRQVMALLALPALVLMAVLLLAGPWLFAWVFGAPWREAGELARALAPYIAAHFVAAPLAVVTMAWQAQRWAFRLALVGQAAFVIALALGLHWGGLRTGAWAVSAVMVPYFGWYFWRLARWRDIPALAGGARGAAP